MNTHHEQDILKRNTELEKELAAKNHELEIEAALERVRSKTNGMHRSENLHDVITEVNDQLRLLGFRFDGTDFLTDYSGKGYNIWVANFPTPVYVPAIDHKIFDLLKEVMTRGDDFFTFTLTTEEKNIHFRNIFENTIAKNSPEELKQHVYNAEGMATSCVVLKNIILSVTNFESIPYSDSENEILNRFAKVFEQSYTRFLDLQKAETQAREAQIEAGLERVRSRSLAMHNTSELQEVIHTVHKELLNLNIAIHGGSFIAINRDIDAELRCWGSGGTANTSEEVRIPFYEKPFCTNLISRIKSAPGFFTEEYTQTEKKDFFTFLLEYEPWSKLDAKQKKEILSSPGGYTRSCCVSQHTSIFIINHFGEKFSAADNDILQRFGKVFEQTYTRFNDLKQAEAQARESQIQLALERVRARTMAMQKSGELAEAASLLFTQIADLGTNSWSSGFIIFQPDELSINSWMSKPDGSMGVPFNIPVTEDPFFIKIYEAYKRGEEFFVMESGGKELEETYRYMFGLPGAAKALGAIEDIGFQMPTFQITHCTFFHQGFLMFITYDPCPEMWDIFKRFGKVFEQTYTRFLDLEKAEAQARESQIQLALERVRARTMAMQHSDELKEAAALLFQQVKSLGAPAYSCGYNIWEKNEKEFTSWMSTQDGSIINGVPNIPLTEDANFIRYVESKQNGEQYFVLELRGERMQQHYEYLKTIPAFKAYFDYSLSVGFDMPETQIHHLANFSHGNLLFITLEPCPEFHDVFKRFAAVFEQTYTRFLDLQKAEAQARESQIEAALERVRSRTMAMQKSEDLNKAASDMFKQIQVLGMQPWACGFNIFDKNERAVTQYMSVADGGISPPFRTPLTEDPFFINIYNARQRRDEFLVMESSGEYLAETYRYMFGLPGSGEIFGDLESSGFEMPKFQITHCAYFSQGYLVFITYEHVSEAHDIFKRFAKVFEQTYTRFLDLQKAEAQAREAQIEAALEKVRSRSLAMHTANELGEVVTVIVEKLKDLGVVLDGNGVVLCTYFQHSKDVMHWIVSPDFSMAASYLLPYFDHPIFNDAWQSRESGVEYFSKSFSVEEKNSFFEYAFEHSDYKYFPEDFKQWIFQNDKHILSFAWQKNSAILIPSHTGVLPTESDKAILIRFAKVFEQSYVRFLDLQKSEEQARESQIQLALERVRARTMAMQKSDELPETSLLLFQQVKELGEITVQNSIGIINEETGFVELSTTVHGHNLPHMLNVPIDDPYVMAKGVAAWKAKRKSLTLEFEGQELKDYNDHRNSFFEKKVNFPEDQWIVNIIFFSKGWLSFSSNKHISDETFDLLKRFAAVFEQTYTRFNDLKQAEEQARESQIQLALERVRARTMAMQKSDELMETAVVLFDQLNQLGEDIERTIIGIMNEEERVVDVWATRPDGSQMEKMQKFPIDEPIVMQKVFAAWGQQKKSIVIDLQGEELETYFQFLKSRGPKLKRESFGERRVENFAFFSKGILGIISVDPNTPANVGLYERFAAVFDQTYTRFLDLQRSEAQAREAQIEAALERVRSRSMGMQKSEELKEVIQVVYEQFVHLNINVEHTGFVMDYKARDDYDIWIADQLGVPSHLTIPYFDCVYYNRFNEAKKKGEDFFTTHLDFEEKNRFYQKIVEYVHRLSEETKEFLFSIPGLAASTVLLENVCLYIENFSGIPFSDEENKILMRFGKVFQQTYTRFLDLQKAEAQARESQIEASLERIRSRTMGMQKSNELKEVATLLNKELIHLGITNFASCGYIEIEEKSNRQHSWLTNPDGVSLEHFFLPLTGEHIFDERYDAWKRKDVVFKQVVHAKELKKHLDFAYSGFGSQESENIGRNFFPDPTIFYSCNFSYGYLSLITGVMLSQAEELLLARFTRVFEQTYSRFLDLQKAEAQAREAKIEAALERVRASTMAMQHSDHLSETAFVLFKQFKELGEAPERIFIATFDNEQDGIIDIWGTNQGGNQLNKLFKVSADEPTLIKKIITAWKEKKRSVVIDLKGEELEQYTSFLRSTGIPVVDGIMEERRVQTIGCFSKGVIGVTTPEPQSAESVQLLERFAGVFDLTYTRFLDLQQAEAQAREAKIEAALERVRSRTMAMQHSDELKDAALLLFQQVQTFGVDQWACGYNIWEADGKTCTAWMSRQGRLQPPFKTHPAVDHCFQRFYDAKQRGESFYVDEIGGDEIKTHYERLISLPEFKSAPKEFFDEFIAPEFQIFHIAYFEQGYLMFITYKPVPQTWDIFKRFAKVFEQTYTRFLDLQKAEAQAREAKIEAALEKVRSRTMAMQTSAELTDVAGLLFEQVSALDIKTWTAGFNVWSEDNNSYVDYITSPQGGFIEPYTVFTETAEALTDISNARKSGVEFDVQYVEGEKIKQLYLALTKLDEKQYEIMLEDGVRFPSHQYEHFVFGSKVSLMFITYEPVPEAHDIFKRLGKVFEQTYTRFLDLQKAEAQAREAIKQASVDRIRAEIASMRTTNDLERIQPLIWNELTTLGVPFTRCGVFIMDEEHEQVDTFLSTPDGRSIASFTSNYSDVAVITEALPYWRKKEIYKAHWDEATFLAQAQTLLSQGNITSAETYLTEHRPKDLYLHFLPFLQGILYVGNETPLDDDELQLVQNLADAFSIAYARYEDFNKLELAKEQIENTLTNLKQAQAQLVQSEKMASLGELTAGIAHEIQNPLNFVNNFSEVNTELIAEMKDEIEKGNIEEVRAIANDIADNEQKINHHGKRADAIVKGMLQHSRSSSGVKEPSDINVLADEYLRLAYHGLRAKDKSFNAIMKTDYDATIGKINIVPQDVGRSVLNLITNAFYAVSEKKKQIDGSLPAGVSAKTGYEPTVTVTTKRINGKVEIRVADNGNGIPQKVLDKIFQPFFTTKPTGEGTGLGLSLSYDIVKAHNGELKVETNVGEGSEFIIFLPANN